MEGERAARNAQGEVYYVPADMTYAEWKKDFVDGGSKDGLTEVADHDRIHLTDKEQWALNEYISSGSYKINPLLREGLFLTDEQRELICQLDSALEKMPIYSGIVYRSLSSSMMDEKSFWDEHALGSTVHYPAYTSSGTVIYDETMDIQMIIQSKTGRDIRRYNAGEHEILFLRNTEFRVTKVEDNTIFMEET